VHAVRKIEGVVRDCPMQRAQLTLAEAEIPELKLADAL
jgi:hypothetical protein